VLEARSFISVCVVAGSLGERESLCARSGRGTAVVVKWLDCLVRGLLLH
jgi:hypothetical protein